ncbi:MAG: TMEM198/TM7SF3 family protein [Acidobacteria bacterium]|nr:TMEM198/TM7SF3 family protein [Acidobacteriota bacterium]
MLPASYQLPAAIVLLVGGIVACFFGYRLFRIVLAFAGFMLGGFAASSMFGMSDTTSMVIAFLVGGLVGAGILFTAYFVGVALIGAGLGAMSAHLLLAARDQDPNFIVLVFLSIAGATVAMYLQRYFIIVGTGFGGAWTMIVGAMAALGDRTAMAAAAAGDVWVAYPMNPAPGQRWLPIAWLALGAIGTAVQVGLTGGEKGRVVRRKKKT